MTNDDYDPKKVYTAEELEAQIMQPEVRAELMHTGMRIVLSLMAGPDTWEQMPPLALSEKNAREARRIVLGNPAMFKDASWIDSQKSVVKFMMDVLWDEFEAWANEAGRGDLLCGSIDLMNAALPPDERV